MSLSAAFALLFHLLLGEAGELCPGRHMVEGVALLLGLISLAIHGGRREGIRGALLASAVLLLVHLDGLRVEGDRVELAIGLSAYLAVGYFLGATSDRMRLERTRVEELSNRLNSYLELVQTMVLALDAEGRVEYANPRCCEVLGLKSDDILGRPWIDSFVSEEEREEVRRVFRDVVEGRLELAKEHTNEVLRGDGTRRTISWRNALLRDGEGKVLAVISSGEDVTELLKARRREESQRRRLEFLYETAAELVKSPMDFRLRGRIACEGLVRVLGLRGAMLVSASRGGLLRLEASHPELEMEASKIEELEEGDPLLRALEEDRPILCQLGEAKGPLGSIKGMEGSFALVVPAGTIGEEEKRTVILVMFGSDRNSLNLPEEDVMAAVTAMRLGLSSLSNALLFEELKRRSERLKTMRLIDEAILDGIELGQIASSLMERIRQALKARGYLLILQGEEEEGEIAGAGGDSSCLFELLDGGRPLGDGVSPVDEERSVWSVELRSRGRRLGHLLLLFDEDDPSREELLRALGDQLAIAVENAALLEELSRKQSEIERAYEETLEGWSSLIDLKDRETEGHSKRVADLALRVGRRMGMSEEELKDLYRGALLHDVGKIAVPDSVLLKPGPLNEEEWRIMRTHPLVAYRALSKVGYLSKALEVPYLHQERWDGSGYPLGLRGKDIPLSARIFAVVDVYDALTSDRPYRRAWSEEEALSYIRRESGRLFDPEVVEAFEAEIQSQRGGEARPRSP